jgi:hypothetical protein
MSNPKYEVWVYPTEINTHAKPQRVAGPFDNRQDAIEAKWFDEMDEPAPDKYDYYQWRIVEVR